VLEPRQLTHVQFVLQASLWWLAEHEDQAPTQARLAQQARADPMMTSQVTRKLEIRSLLERAFDPTDNRARGLRLTAAGRALVARALADVEAADNEFFSALGAHWGTFTQDLQTLGSGSLSPYVIERHFI
jgi:DNA-binding MarR family transcriptional regulator